MSTGDHDPRPCPECGGERVHAAMAHTVQLWPADAMGVRRTVPRALVCTGCGHTTLYVDDPLAFRPRQKRAD